jgi:hypothetical protein
MSVWRSRVFTTIILFIMLCFGQIVAQAADWGAVLLPASLNNDRTVRLLGEQTQVITFILQASDEVRARGAKHHIEVAFDLPTGFEAIYSEGYYQFTKKSSRTVGARTITTYDAEVTNGFLVGAPGSPINSEWRVHSLFLKTAKQIAPGEDYLGLQIRDAAAAGARAEGAIESLRWPLSLTEMKPPVARPKRTTLGLWDYNFYRSNDAVTSEGLARLFKDSGIGFTHYAEYEVYHQALKKQGILTGGNTLNASFYSSEYADADPAGHELADEFSNPQAIIDLPKGAPIPGVKTLLNHARLGDNIATFDFEPDGAHGFGEPSVREFKKRNKVSDADFAKFRAHVAENRLLTFQSTDPLIQRIWKQWTEFRSQQIEGYTRRIYQDLKAQAPDVKLAITSRVTMGKDSSATLAVGTDNSVMARYCDMMMPQIYCGYGAANTKLAIETSARWAAELRRQKSGAELWPLLLVRYAGASVANSPLRLRQQAIGSLTQGAKGILFYYPGNMDAPYWTMAARLTEDIAKYEDFYHDGKRVDELYKLSELPQGMAQVSMWPGYTETVQNPGWAFTAHELNGKVLLTLMNLEEANDLVFGVEVGNTKLVASQDAELIKGRRAETGTLDAANGRDTALSGTAQWLVAPGQIGYVILEGGANPDR